MTAYRDDAEPAGDDVDVVRATRVISHLDGTLDEQTLAAMQDVWSMLEHAATDAPSHGRAVRSRLFWAALAPGRIAAAPSSLMPETAPAWNEDDEPESILDGRSFAEHEADAA